MTAPEVIEAFLADLSDPLHGTITGYRRGCRCVECAKAGACYAFACAPEAGKADRPRTRRARLDKCTVPEFLKPLMGKPDIDNPDRLCAVCGRPATNMHHIVRRSAGEWVRDGKKVPKPLVRLCGGGNASGCHGMAHDGRLHFRWNEAKSRWEFRVFPEPMGQLEALQAEGWWAPFERW